MLAKVKRFYNNLPRYSRDREITKRLPGAVAKAMRSSYYELKNSPDFEDVFRKHLLAAFVDTRIIERARRSRRVRECFDLAEKIAKDLLAEVQNGDVRRFFESFVKLYEVKKSRIEL